MTPVHDLSVGAELPSRAFGPLTRTDFVRYQGASGDFNPMHHDDEFARSAGFATDWLGAKNVRRYAVQFREQVWPGDSVVCSGAITRKYEEDGERKVDVDLVCTRVASGGGAIKGEATFVVP